MVVNGHCSVFPLITWELRRPWPSFRLPWSCSWSPLSFVELDLNSEDRLTKTTLAAPSKSTTSAHHQFFARLIWILQTEVKRISHLLVVCIIYTMEEKVSQSRLLSWHKKQTKIWTRRTSEIWLSILQAKVVVKGNSLRKPSNKALLCTLLKGTLGKPSFANSAVFF